MSSFPPTPATRYTQAVMSKWREDEKLDLTAMEQKDVSRFNRKFEEVYEMAEKLYAGDKEAFIKKIQAEFNPNQVLMILFGSIAAGKNRLRKIKEKKGPKGARHTKPKKRR